MALRKLGPVGLIDEDVFLAEASKRLFGGKANASQKAGMVRLLNAWDEYGTDIDTQFCYVIATSYWETGRRMQPVLETFASTRAQGAARLQRAFDRGQLKWVKTPYWNKKNGFHWIGGGDVQLTHESNYRGALRQAVLREFDKDIYTNPDLVLDSAISGFILIEGMMSAATLKNDFTGQALEKFVNASSTDYHNARKSVNPGDKSSYAEIAKIAGDFEVALGKARSAGGSRFSGPETDIYNGRYDAQVEEAQKALHRLGYTEVGTADGRWGSRTRGATLAYRADAGLPLVPKLDAEMLASLVGAEKRPVSKARAEATVADLRVAGSTDIARSDSMGRVGKIAVAGGTALAGAEETGILDKLSDQSYNISTAMNLLGRVKGVVEGNSMLIIIALGAGLVYFAWQANKNRVSKHQSGEYLSR